MVDTIASTIATNFSVVGVVENRVSMVADNFKSAGAGPLRGEWPTMGG